MRGFIIFLFITIMAVSCTKNDFTGIWKVNCTEYYGLQIVKQKGEMYSISFCGLNGCANPEEWAPNSKIVGDSSYIVTSDKQIEIRHKNDFNKTFKYQKCTSDPTWKVSPTPILENKAEMVCKFSPKKKTDEILVAWITNIRETGDMRTSETNIVESFRPLFTISGKTIKEATGDTIAKGDKFWPLVMANSSPLALKSVSTFLDHMNYEHCVFSGTLEKNKLPEWTLLSSKKISGFRAPKKTEREQFYKLNTTCINQGDYDEGKEPPCVRPQILAVSDVNKNGKIEYWATEPYLWDTGVRIWELNGKKLESLLEVCVGCSD